MKIVNVATLALGQRVLQQVAAPRCGFGFVANSFGQDLGIPGFMIFMMFMMFVCDLVFWMILNVLNVLNVLVLGHD